MRDRLFHVPHIEDVTAPRLAELDQGVELTGAPEPKWVDLFGIDPDYCDGMDVDEWLDANRGEA